MQPSVGNADFYACPENEVTLSREQSDSGIVMPVPRGTTCPESEAIRDSGMRYDFFFRSAKALCALCVRKNTLREKIFCVKN
jgi:hypothetical protein